MKRLMMILAVTMIFLALGCEKRAGQAEEADRYDEAIDGPVCVLTVSADENLLADQRKISRQAKLDAETPVEIEEKAGDEDTGGEDTTPVATPAPAGDSISAVKQVLGEAIVAAKAKQYEQLMKVYTDADAAAIKGLMSSVKQLPVKLKTLEKLSQSKLGLPEGAMELIIDVMIGGFPTPADDLADLDIEQLKFKTDGGNVVVASDENPSVTFVSTPSGWKLKMDPLDKQMVGPLGNLFAKTNKAIDEITAGINSGDITRENGKAKMDEIFEKYVKPARKKVDELFTESVRDAPDSAKPKPPTPKPAIKPRPRPEERPSMPGERRPRPDKRRQPDKRPLMPGERRRR